MALSYLQPDSMGGVFSFLIVLKEAFKLIPKNGKIMALVALFSVLLSMITYAAFCFSILSLSQDLSVKTSINPRSFQPATPSQLQDQLNHMNQILAILYAVEIAFTFIFIVISFITTMATIVVSAVSYTRNTLSVKDLCSRIAKTWTKPFLTSIYVSIHAIGFSVIFGLFVVPAVIYPNTVTILIAILLALVMFLLYLYLLVIWALAIVVSVVEKGCYGMVAMGKASEIVKGQILKGYVLNLFFFLVTSIILVIYEMIYWKEVSLNGIFYGLFLVGLCILMKILQVVAYTVLYFHCKKQHGEDAEIYMGVVKYGLLPTTDPVN